MADEIKMERRDLVARVATLELLVKDLVSILWRLDPKAMEKLAAAADQDLEIQNTRTMAVAEHQRERLYTVLNTRQRMLKPRKGDVDTYVGGGARG